MTRAIFYTATTLNGFLADENHSLEWLFAVPGADEAEADIPDFTEGIGVIVEGSSTYRWVVEHESLLSEPHKWQEFYGERPVFVFSSQQQALVPGADIRVVSGDVRDIWDEIVTAAGDKDIWIMGGGALAAQFAEAGLLDELHLTVAPVTLASGAPLFPATLGSDRLELTSVRQVGQFAELRYRVR